MGPRVTNHDQRLQSAHSAATDVASTSPGESVTLLPVSSPGENPDLFSRHEVGTYWKRVHNLATERFAGRDHELLPVVAGPGAPDWEKRYVAHFQHKAMLRTLRHVPEVAGLRGLEFGCGTGRWVRLLAERGADMVGIDISEDVIERNRKAIPQAEFRCVDVTHEPVERESYDFVLSVTVIQHLPYEVQDEAVRALGDALKPGGIMVMLENIHDRARTVFPRSIDGWTALAARNGLERTHSGVFAFDVLPRLGRRLLGLSGFRNRAEEGLSKFSPEELAEATYERYKNAKQHRRYAYVFRPLVTASYIVEPVTRLILPSSWATHCGFVFKKRS